MSSTFGWLDIINNAQTLVSTTEYNDIYDLVARSKQCLQDEGKIPIFVSDALVIMHIDRAMRVLGYMYEIDYNQELDAPQVRVVLELATLSIPTLDTIPWSEPK